MSKARLVITAITVEKRPVSEVARSYGSPRSWACTLLARYQAEGEAAFEPRSRRPKASPAAINAGTWREYSYGGFVGGDAHFRLHGDRQKPGLADWRIVSLGICGVRASMPSDLLGKLSAINQ